MNLMNEIKAFQRKVQRGEYEFAPENWAGGDVVITDTEPVRNASSFYPAPIFVVTQHAKALSWLFEQLSFLYHAHTWEGYEDKFRFYGELANSANEAIGREPQLAAEKLLEEVLACAMFMGNHHLQ